MAEILRPNRLETYRRATADTGLLRVNKESYANCRPSPDTWEQRKMSLFFVSCLANHNCLSPHVLFKHGLSDSLTQDFIYGKLALRESIIHAKAPMRNKGPTLSKKWINIPVEVLLFITLHSKFNRTNIWKISIRKRVNSGNDIFCYIRAVKYLVAFVKEYKRATTHLVFLFKIITATSLAATFSGLLFTYV